MEGIRIIFGYDDGGIWVVFQVFGYFFVIFSEYNVVDDIVFERGDVKEVGVKNEKSVELVFGLIKVFGNEVIRKVFFKFFFVFKGIVFVGIRYVVRFKLIVKDFFNVFEGVFVLFVGNGDVVNFVMVEICDFIFIVIQFFQFFNVVNVDMFFFVIVDLQGDGSILIFVVGYVLVLSICDLVCEMFFFDK